MLDTWTFHWKEAILKPFAPLFSYVHPNVISLASFVAGLFCAYYASIRQYHIGLGLWILNRTLDGLDGIVARAFNKVTDFGGYLGMVLDFTIYGIVPVSIVYGKTVGGQQCDVDSFLALAFLEVSYCANVVSLFYLAAILEQKRISGRASMSMPKALAEGTETIIAYILFFVYPQHTAKLFAGFAGIVGVTVLHRLVQAYVQLHPSYGATAPPASSVMAAWMASDRNRVAPRSGTPSQPPITPERRSSRGDVARTPSKPRSASRSK